MPDIFGRQQDFKATSFVTSDLMVLKVGKLDTKSVTEFLVQGVSVQFNQPLNRLYEIGSGFVYYAPGRALGTCQISKIVGNKPITALLGDPAQGIWVTGNENDSDAHTLSFFTKSNSSTTLKLKYVMTGAIVEGYSMNTDANGLLIQETVSLQIASLYFGAPGDLMTQALTGAV